MFEEVRLAASRVMTRPKLARSISPVEIPEPRDLPITEATAGNPFFIQELTRHLQEEGRRWKPLSPKPLLLELGPRFRKVCGRWSITG